MPLAPPSSYGERGSPSLEEYAAEDGKTRLAALKQSVGFAVRRQKTPELRSEAPLDALPSLVVALGYDRFFDCLVNGIIHGDHRRRSHDICCGTRNEHVAWLGHAYYEGHWRDCLYHGGGRLISTNRGEFGRSHNGFQHGYGKMIHDVTPVPAISAKAIGPKVAITANVY
ncbi:unnamed protein product [Zymoseptoria tritici ST99CH_1E4]|uniref:Uncharacterized protein n=1 Tax=Zymoseptoria tritici ST99CH_1E4 TaxID=1276532 RepID=A0A2H1H978_ZYMTR|nr:unnamed protein product [Zymoseptoria tritici ST99CH_1E4]